ELRYSSIVSSGANRTATLVPCHFRARVEPKTEPEVDNSRGTPANRRLSRQYPDVLCRKSWRQSALSGGMLPQNASASPTSLDRGIVPSRLFKLPGQSAMSVAARSGQPSCE